MTFTTAFGSVMKTFVLMSLIVASACAQPPGTWLELFSNASDRGIVESWSSTSTSHRGAVGWMAVDGDNRTMWRSRCCSCAGQNIVFNFQRPMRISAFAILNAADVTHDVKNFNLRVGTTRAGPWTNVLSGTASAGVDAFDVFNFTCFESQYFQFYIRNCYNRWEPWVREIRFQEAPADDTCGTFPPTYAPTRSPTRPAPTVSPTIAPTTGPTTSPTTAPTSEPTLLPTVSPAASSPAASSTTAPTQERNSGNLVSSSGGDSGAEGATMWIAAIGALGGAILIAMVYIVMRRRKRAQRKESADGGGANAGRMQSMQVNPVYKQQRPVPVFATGTGGGLSGGVPGIDDRHYVAENAGNHIYEDADSIQPFYETPAPETSGGQQSPLYEIADPESPLYETVETQKASARARSATVFVKPDKGGTKVVQQGQAFSVPLQTESNDYIGVTTIAPPVPIETEQTMYELPVSLNPMYMGEADSEEC